MFASRQSSCAGSTPALGINNVWCAFMFGVSEFYPGLTAALSALSALSASSVVWKVVLVVASSGAREEGFVGRQALRENSDAFWLFSAVFNGWCREAGHTFGRPW